SLQRWARARRRAGAEGRGPKCRGVVSPAATESRRLSDLSPCDRSNHAMMKTSLALAFAATAVLLTETMSTFAREITDSPHREIVDANTYPWSSIGKVGAKRHWCTGVVVGS